MASANNSTRKRTPDSSVGDSSGAPTPKRTCDSNSNVEDVNDQKEEVIQSLKEMSDGSALAITKLLSCDACKSFARPPIRNCGLKSGMRHTICSSCFTDGGTKCPIEGCTGQLTMVNEELTSMFRAMNLSVPCKNRKNGCFKKGKEKEVEEHEIECEYRMIHVVGKPDIMFKDFLSLMKTQVQKNDRKWKSSSLQKTCIIRDSIEPDGHIFRTYIRQEGSLIKAYVRVIAGENVAKKYRVELRLYSSELETTLTHHGPVLSRDSRQPKGNTNEKAFIIDKKRFALFNKGFDHFEHNKEENGEITVPIMVKIIKKELDIPKEASITLVD